MTAVFTAIFAHTWPSGAPSELRVAVYNVGWVVRKPFLRITTANIDGVVNANVNGAFAFARGAIERFRANALDASTAKSGSPFFVQYVKSFGAWPRSARP